jgi:hypothetical protein
MPSSAHAAVPRTSTQAAVNHRPGDEGRLRSNSTTPTASTSTTSIAVTTRAISALPMK